MPISSKNHQKNKNTGLDPVLLIHPPVAKPSEPPAGVARLAGALKFHGIDCTLIDANIEGLYYLLENITPPADTWSKRAHKHLQKHLSSLQKRGTYENIDKHRRSVNDINRLLSWVGNDAGIRISLANYEDQILSPVRSSDLLQAAQHPERNPYYEFFQLRLMPKVKAIKPQVIGISINYLSQALCAFALIGLLKKSIPSAKIIIGGGLITSWLKRPHWAKALATWVDEMICGPGEATLLKTMGAHIQTKFHLPEYDQLMSYPYLSPGFVLPFSISDGCWWKRCSFCPEKAEDNPYRALPRRIAIDQLKTLTRATQPAMIHLLDNAIAPAMLKKIAADPPGAPWYGFVRISPPLDDPDFCRQLARSGCTMLKVGIESGDQKVLDALGKGIRLDMTSKILRNIHEAGIATYIYLLFGTPAEDKASAEKTLHFTAEHQEYIDFLNLAIFNLPMGCPDSDGLQLHAFYHGDLALYTDFQHPLDWNRAAVRQFVDKRFKRHPAIQPILRCEPLVFTSNHAPFFAQPFYKQL